MESWRDSLSKYVESWTSPAKEGEGDGAEAATERFDGGMTASDEEAQLSYPGTDDEEFEGSEGDDERWADASEDDEGEDFNPAEAAQEALQDALRMMAAGEEGGPASAASAAQAQKQAYGMPSFRDILMGRKTEDGGAKKEEAVKEEDEEWETDDDEASPEIASPAFPKLGSKTPSPAEKKVEDAPPAQKASAFKPFLPARAAPKKQAAPTLPPKPAPEAASSSSAGGAETAAAVEEKKAKPVASGFFKRPALPPRPAARKSAESSDGDTKPEEEKDEEVQGPTTDAYARGGAGGSQGERAQPQAQPQQPNARAQALQAMIQAQQQEAQRQQAAMAAQELTDEQKKLAETVMDHRVKLIRIAKRLGVGADNHVIKQVIFRLDMTEQVKLYGRSSRVAVKETFKEAEERAAAMEEGGEDLDLECTVLLIGKQGVGKSTLVNNLLGREDEPVERHSGGCQVREVEGEAYGVKMRFIDVPGLQSSRAESRRNRKILQAAKRATKKRMPDIVLYCDRLDVPSYDFADIPLVRDISSTFGASIWWNALIVFTHGGSRAPEDSAGQIANFEYFQNHRGYVVQQMIRQAAGDARILNPVSVVECHHATKRNDRGEKLLPSGQAWKTYILLLCYASKVLHDANVALKLDNGMKDNKAAKNAQYAAFRRQQTPYPLFFNNLFQTRKPRRAQNLVSEEELEEQQAVQEMEEMESEHGMPGQEKDYPLNPFKQPLDHGDSRIDIPAPDPALAPTFDCDPSTNAHRYRYLENSNGWICRAIVEPDGLEHDDGINGFTAENYYGTMADPTSKDPRKKNPIPTYVMSQVNMPEKGKMTLVAEVEGSMLHKGKGTKDAAEKGQKAAEQGGMAGKPPGAKESKPPVTTGGVDVQSLGRDIMYVARTETRVRTSEKMKTCAGVSAFRSSLKFPHTGPLAFGAKVEERVKLNKQLRLNMTAGAIGGKAADGKTNQYLKGANVQFMVKGNKKKGEPTKLQVIGTAMHWKKDIALGGDIQAIQMVGPDSALTARANLNSRGSGSVQLRLTSTDTIKYGLVGLVPTVSALWGFLTGSL